MQSDLTCRTTSTPELRTSQVRLDPTLPHHQTRRSLSFSSYAFGFLLLVATVAWIPPHAAHFGRATLPVTVVSGSPISNEHDDSAISRIERRTNSPVDVCFRWAQQCTCDCEQDTVASATEGDTDCIQRRSSMVRSISTVVKPPPHRDRLRTPGTTTSSRSI